jgi:hypothetical protein
VNIGDRFIDVAWMKAVNPVVESRALNIEGHHKMAQGNEIVFLAHHQDSPILP